jgi:hypothetical protein
VIPLPSFQSLLDGEAVIRRTTFWIVAVAVAPVMLLAAGSLGAKIYSSAANPIFFGFHIGEDEAGFDVNMLRPVSASLVLIGCSALLFRLRRSLVPK